MYIEAIIITNIPQAEIGMMEVYCLRVGRPLNEAVIVMIKNCTNVPGELSFYPVNPVKSKYPASGKLNRVVLLKNVLFHWATRIYYVLDQTFIISFSTGNGFTSITVI